MLLNYKAKGVTDYWNRPVPFQTTPVHYLNFTYLTQKINTLIYLMLFLAFKKNANERKNVHALNILVNVYPILLLFIYRVYILSDAS